MANSVDANVPPVRFVLLRGGLTWSSQAPRSGDLQPTGVAKWRDFLARPMSMYAIMCNPLCKDEDTHHGYQPID